MVIIVTIGDNNACPFVIIVTLNDFDNFVCFASTIGFVLLSSFDDEFELVLWDLACRLHVEASGLAPHSVIEGCVARRLPASEVIEGAGEYYRLASASTGNCNC